MKDHTDDYIAEEETSTRKPIELYHIWRGEASVSGEQILVEHWRYTSYSEPIHYKGNWYYPATIQRGTVTYDSQFEVTTLDINVAYLVDPVMKYIATNPVDMIWVQVMKYYEDVIPEEASVVFVGQIKTVSFQGTAATISCVGFEHFLTQRIPKYRYQISCNNDLFDDLCTLEKDDYEETATVTILDSAGVVINATEFGDEDENYYTRGFIRWRDAYTNPDTGYKRDHYRMIVKHIGQQASIRYKFNDFFKVGETIYIYAGCDKQIATCRSKFSNIVNFFGHPWIPTDNPATWIPK